MSDYFKKLKDPRWQQVRLKVMERDNWACRMCSVKEGTLNVHHTLYDGDPWDVPRETLLTLCDQCHKNFEDIVKAVRLQLNGHWQFEASWKFVSLVENGFSEELNSIFVAFQRRPDVIKELVLRADGFNEEWLKIKYPGWSGLNGRGAFNTCGDNI